MDTRPFDPADRGVRPVHKLAASRLRFGWGDARYRLDIVGHSIADVVENAGGWLFDRALAGWDVAVLVAEPSDDRPLRILGAQMLDLGEVLDSGGSGRQPHALAVAAAMAERDSRMSAGLHAALDDGGLQVVGWGEGWPVGPGYRVDPVWHRLSAAARVFKAQALAAAGNPTPGGDGVGGFEFLCTGAAWWPPVVADLSPVN
ncbi:hypothetical protein [Nocardia sp. NPDC051750]|uniref:hypothetical protein n=1 Tax=Nocardia sp. NPDC051750 TaxID=3364325 RepID=UPI0037B37E19